MDTADQGPSTIQLIQASTEDGKPKRGRSQIWKGVSSVCFDADVISDDVRAC